MQKSCSYYRGIFYCPVATTGEYFIALKELQGYIWGKITSLEFENYENPIFSIFHSTERAGINICLMAIYPWNFTTCLTSLGRMENKLYKEHIVQCSSRRHLIPAVLSCHWSRPVTSILIQTGWLKICILMIIIITNIMNYKYPGANVFTYKDAHEKLSSSLSPTNFHRHYHHYHHYCSVLTFGSYLLCVCQRVKEWF